MTRRELDEQIDLAIKQALRRGVSKQEVQQVLNEFADKSDAFATEVVA